MVEGAGVVTAPVDGVDGFPVPLPVAQKEEVDGVTPFGNDSGLSVRRGFELAEFVTLDATAVGWRTEGDPGTRGT